MKSRCILGLAGGQQRRVQALSGWRGACMTKWPMASSSPHDGKLYPWPKLWATYSRNGLPMRSHQCNIL